VLIEILTAIQPISPLLRAYGAVLSIAEYPTHVAHRSSDRDHSPNLSPRSAESFGNFAVEFPLLFAHNGKGNKPMPLTKRQKQVLDFIAHFQDENGYCPSYEEIAHGLDLASLATVHKHISSLEAKSYLKRGFNQSRSLELAPKYLQEQRRSRPLTEVPLLGRIAAGAPVESVAQRETLNFAEFTSNANTFALEVRGNSMIDDHICDGDLILLERVAQARDGDIVVALVAGSETTLKRFYRAPGDQIRLQPANSTLKPIIVPARDVQIQGRLLAVLRKYR
jgi:repressor LexA